MSYFAEDGGMLLYENKERDREAEFEAFKKAYEDVPSQDNEGWVPCRGSFKCGWFAALDWREVQK